MPWHSGVLAMICRTHIIYIASWYQHAIYVIMLLAHTELIILTFFINCICFLFKYLGKSLNANNELCVWNITPISFRNLFLLLRQFSCCDCSLLAEKDYYKNARFLLFAKTTRTNKRYVYVLDNGLLNAGRHVYH